MSKKPILTEEELLELSDKHHSYPGNGLPTREFIQLFDQAKAAIQLEAENQKLREENERLTLKIEKHNAVMQEFRKAFPGLCLFKFGQ